MAKYADSISETVSSSDTFKAVVSGIVLTVDNVIQTWVGDAYVSANNLIMPGKMTISGNTVIKSAIVANNTPGTAGYYLRTSGTGIYWSPIAGVSLSGYATWSALTATNTAIRTLVNSTNTSLRTLVSDRLQVANASTLYATKVSDNAKLQVANAVATYATKVAPTTSGLHAHTGRATVSTNLTVSGNTITNTILSSDSNLGYKLNTTTKRQIFSAYGFDFYLDNGIITPITGSGKSRGAYGGQTATSWTVPAGVYYIYVKMWGAGGGGGSYGGWRQGSLGGAGGFSCGLVPVVPGESLTFIQGGRGNPNNGATGAYPDGGAASTGGGDSRYAAAGGGSSRLLVPSIHATIYTMIAGGGGGGGAVNGYACNSGGAGGGLIGQTGRISQYTGSDHPGKGGTQSAGGAAGTGSVTTGGAGSYLQGGTHQNANCYGGGGGGGYYGGGSGAYGNSNSMGGGGGGSGYIHANVIMGQTHMGSGSVTPFNWDPDYCAVGGTGSINDWGMGGDESGYGGPGLIIFYY